MRTKMVFTIGGSIKPVTRAFSSISIHKLTDHVVEMRMEKAPVNSFDSDMLKEFASSVKRLENDTNVKGLVLTSAFPRVFSAGLDLKELTAPSEENFKRFWRAVQHAWKSYYLSPLVTVAAINGSSPAMGAILALSSDYRLMGKSDKARFGLNETSLGMIPPPWLMALTAQVIGTRQAELHLLMGTLCLPHEAKAVGYVDGVCEPDELLATAIAWCDKACAIPRQARGALKIEQRKQIASLCDESSVSFMSNCVLGTEFQSTLARVLEGLKKKK